MSIIQGVQYRSSSKIEGCNCTPQTTTVFYCAMLTHDGVFNVLFVALGLRDRSSIRFISMTHTKNFINFNLLNVSICLQILCCLYKWSRFGQAEKVGTQFFLHFIFSAFQLIISIMRERKQKINKTMVEDSVFETAGRWVSRHGGMPIPDSVKIHATSSPV